MAFDWFTLIIIPFLIFFSRVIDVSLGTLRVIFISRGYKSLAPIVAFFEVLIWLFAAKQVLVNLNVWYLFIIYAGGFAVGTYVGIIIDEKLKMGKVLVRIITKKESKEMFHALKEAKFNVSKIVGIGNNGRVEIIFTITKRKNIDKIYQIITKINRHAFYTVEDIRYAHEEFHVDMFKKNNKPKLFSERKGK
ncbi:DUF2179 domain-containing protein [Nanoarchaeota archaeon]